MARHFSLGAEVESAGNKNNGEHHEEHPKNLPAHAEFTIPKGPSAVDGEERPHATPLLSQTDMQCAGGDAKKRG